VICAHLSCEDVVHVWGGGGGAYSHTHLVDVQQSGQSIRHNTLDVCTYIHFLGLKVALSAHRLQLLYSYIRKSIYPAMPKTMPTFSPFSVHRGVVVEGGFLTAPWAVKTISIGDRDFITLYKCDRMLAKALGLNMSERAPFQTSSVFEHRAAARDRDVDKLIITAQKDDDPMAENDGDNDTMTSTNRTVKFNDVAPPNFIPITFAAFVTENGERVDARSINIITTPKRCAAVSIEITPDSMGWLAKAFASTQDIFPSPSKKQKHAPNVSEHACMPELTTRCRYTTTNTGRGGLVLYYRTATGESKRHVKTLQLAPSADGFTQHVHDTEAQCMQFFDANNYGDGNDEDCVSGDEQAVTHDGDDQTGEVAGDQTGEVAGEQPSVATSVDPLARMMMTR
jgi:hypothetical protein